MMSRATCSRVSARRVRLSIRLCLLFLCLLFRQCASNIGNLLLFLLAPEFSYRAMEWMVVLHVFLAGLFMYLCLRYMEP